MTEAKTFIGEDSFLVGKGSVAARGGASLDGPKAMEALSQGMDFGAPLPAPLPERLVSKAEIIRYGVEFGNLSADARDVLTALADDFEEKRRKVWNLREPKKDEIDNAQSLSVCFYGLIFAVIEPSSFTALEPLYVRMFCAGKEHGYGLTGFLAKKWKALSHDEQSVLRQETVILSAEDTLSLSRKWQVFLSQWDIHLFDLFSAAVEDTPVGGRAVGMRDIAEKVFNETLRRLVSLFRGAFYLGQFHALLEQGISYVQWVTHLDSKSSICHALNGRTLPISHLLQSGNNNPQTSFSHPLCTCDLRPVISYVVTPLSQAERNPVTLQFLQGDPVFGTNLLEPSDVVRAVVTVGNKSNVTLQRVPVEHIAPIDALARRIGSLCMSVHFPRTIVWARDIYELDEFQHEAQPASGMGGMIVSWWRGESKVLYLSSYAAEFAPIEEALIEAWALRIWWADSVVRASFGEQKEGERVLIDLGADTMRALRRVLRPAPLLDRFTIADGQACEGFALSLLSIPEVEFRASMRKAGLSEELISRLASVRALQPLWKRDGSFVRFLRDAEAKRVWQMDAGRFQRAVLTLFCRPATLKLRDAALHQRLVKLMYADIEDDKLCPIL